MGIPFIPFVYGIPSDEVFGNPSIPSYAGIPSNESFGSPKVGIWWLKWREFDKLNMYSRVFKAFSAVDERYQYAENLMSEMELSGKYRYSWKFIPKKFGRPVLPKRKFWNHIEIWITEGLR